MEDPLVEETLLALQQVIENEQKRAASVHKAFAEQFGKAQQSLGEFARMLDAERANLDAHPGTALERLAALRDLLEKGVAGESDTREQLVETEAQLAMEQEARRRDTERLAALNQELSDQKAAVQASRQRMNELEQELASRSSALESEKQQVASLEQALQERSQGEEGARSELTRLHEMEQNLRGELEEARSKLAGLESAHKTQQQALMEAQAKVEALRVRAEAAEEAQGELEGLRGEITQLKKTAADRDEKLTRASEAEKTLETERERTRDLEEKLRLETAKGTKASLAAQLADAIKENEDAQEEILRLRHEIDQYRRTYAPHDSNGDLQRILTAAGNKGGAKRTIGEILIEAGLITQEQLEEALDEQRKNPNRHLGALLIERGYTGEDAIAQALACQCNVKFVHLADMNVAPTAAALITERLANQHQCLPVRTTDEGLILAMVNPLDLLAIEDVERTTNRKVEIVVVTPSDIKEAIAKYYWEPE